MKAKLLACSLGCATGCINCWRCFWCQRCKSSNRGGAYYEKLYNSSSFLKNQLNTQQQKQAAEAKSFTKVPPKDDSSSDEASMYNKAPSVKSAKSKTSHQSQGRYSSVPPTSHQSQQVNILSPHHKKTPTRILLSTKSATSRKIRMPSMTKGNHHSSAHHPSSMQQHRHQSVRAYHSHHTPHHSQHVLHQGELRHHRSQQIPLKSHAVPHHHSSARGMSHQRSQQHSSRQIPLHGHHRSQRSIRQPLNVYQRQVNPKNPLTMPSNQNSSSRHQVAQHSLVPSLAHVRSKPLANSHHTGHGPIPWTTVTAATTEGSKHKARSPAFEQTSGARRLQYTTSATGAFNTAEEFYSPNNSEVLLSRQGKSSESMFLPRGYSGASNLSQQHIKLPGNGYEVISLSSSQVGCDSEPSTIGVIH